MPPAAPPRPTRWLRRITLAMLIAGLAWWAVYELVRPQPRFQFLLPPGRRIADARWLGSWCAMRIQDQRPGSHLEDRTIFFDFSANRFINPPVQFNKSYIQELFDTSSVRSLDHYIIKHGSLYPSTLRIHDTIAGVSVEHHFSDHATLHLTTDNTTLFESTTLPLAPWAALSPAPFSVVPAALLMSCDAQRLCNYEIGFQLVQVRQLPSLNIIGRYALPPHTQVYTLNVSADGKHLLHGFNHVLHEYLQTNGGTEASPDITRPIPREIPNNLRMWKTLRWMFPESLESLREWTRTAINLDRYDKLQSELWVKTDLTGIWSDLGTAADIYNAHTGQKLYSTTFEKSGKPMLCRCMSLQQDWAFISQVHPPDQGKLDDPMSNDEPEQVCLLHLPTGRQLEPPTSIQYYRKNGMQLVRGSKDGVALGKGYYTVTPPGSSASLPSVADLNEALFLFNADGTMQVINKSLEIEREISSELDYVTIVPYTNQLVMQKFWKFNLPKWLKDYAADSPWLMKLLRNDHLAVIDAESNKTLWSFDPIDQSSRTSKTEYVPSILHSTDERIIVVPVLLDQNLDQDFAHYRYDVYCLPFSTWLPRWPYLAALLTLILLISQGFASCRFRFVRAKTPVCSPHAPS